MVSSPLVEFIRLTCEANAQYGVQVFSKSKKWRPLWLLGDFLLKKASFGKNKDSYKKMATTLGPYVFFPAGWESRNADLVDCVRLRHELVHVRQFRACGLGSAWLGLLVFCILYALFPLPVGFAWFRYATERTAYKTSVEAWRDYGVNIAPDYYADKISGPEYLWAWPKAWVQKWFLKKLG